MEGAVGLNHVARRSNRPEQPFSVTPVWQRLDRCPRRCQMTGHQLLAHGEGFGRLSAFARRSPETAGPQMVFVFGLHGFQHLRRMLLQHLDQRLSLAVHSLDGGHALVGLSTHEVDIAHQSQALEQEDLVLWFSFFPPQHHVAKLGGHDLGKFQSTFLHVAFNLMQGLRRVLHPEHGTDSPEHPRGYDAFASSARSEPCAFIDHRRRGSFMDEDWVLAISGTPGVGKSSLCAVLEERGWNVLSLAKLADQHGCLDDIDTEDGAAPIDIHRLADAWEASSSGRWVVDGHLSHLLDVNGIILLRCAPSTLKQRLEARGYPAGKVRANVEWEMTAGHWAELLEFEVELPVLELDAGQLSSEELAGEVEGWCGEGLPSQSMEDGAVDAIDWLGESLD